MIGLLFSAASLIAMAALEPPNHTSAPALTLRAELTWGAMGPPREHSRYSARDAVFYRLVIGGLSTDKLGNVHCVIRTDLRRPDGRLETVQRHERPALSLWGAATLSCSFCYTIDSDLAAGAFALVVTVVDRYTGQEASVELPLEVQPKEFALLGPVFYADPKGTMPCGPGGVCGLSLFLKVGVIGHGLANGKSNARCVVEVFEPDGRVVHSVRSEPLTLAGPLVSFDIALPLMKSGDFRLRITVLDDATGQRRTVETPLRVRES